MWKALVKWHQHLHCGHAVVAVAAAPLENFLLQWGESIAESIRAGTLFLD